MFFCIHLLIYAKQRPKKSLYKQPKYSWVLFFYNLKRP